MRVLRSLLAGLLGLQVAVCAPVDAAADAVVARDEPTRTVERTVPSTTFANRVIFSPPSNAGWTDPRVLYARVVELQSGALLATWENYSPEPPLVHYPIYRSLDGGMTWTEISRVEDQVNGWGMRYQPFLYELPQAFGEFPAGTIVCAGNSIPTDLSRTKIDVYVSTDEGLTWTFVSSVAEGGEAIPNNGLTPVWEPFIMTYQEQLVIYYADQRDSRFGQKLTHTFTNDLLSWSFTTEVVNPDVYEGRPGMPVVAELPNGQYFLAYELCGTDGCRIHYRMSDDPLYGFRTARDYSLVSDRGTRPVSSPYVVWSSVGGPNGSIVLSAGSTTTIFVNSELGAEGAWRELDTPQPRAYTRALMVYRDDPNILGIIGAGWLPPSSTNYVSNSAIDLEETGV